MSPRMPQWECSFHAEQVQMIALILLLAQRTIAQTQKKEIL